MMKKDHFFLVDGSSYVFRAYHALPALKRKTDGLPIGAVAGFCNMIWKLLKDIRNNNLNSTPSHFAVIFDHSSHSFRNKIYPEYKANRSAVPEDLCPQFSLVRQATRAFNLACIEKEGYEADDLIATYTRMANEAGACVTIISSDKDLMQLVSSSTVMYDQMKNHYIGVQQVIEKFGVTPEKMIDLQALAGDSTDNIPGIPGIGPKIAAQLLNQYGSLEILLARANEIKQNKRRENIIKSADLARLSKNLVTLDQQVSLDVALDQLKMRPYEPTCLIGFLKAMEINTLTGKIAEYSKIDANTIKAAHIGIEGYQGKQQEKKLDTLLQTNDSIDQKVSPGHFVKKRIQQINAQKIDFKHYECIRDLSKLEEWITKIYETGLVAIDTETNSLNAMQADLVGISLATEPGKACYIPITHKLKTNNLLGYSFVENQIAMEDAVRLLKPVLEDTSILKIGQNLKYDWHILRQHGIMITAFDDTMLISYVLNAGLHDSRGHGINALAERWLNHHCISFKEVTGSGKSAITFDFVDLDKATNYAAEDADITLRLWMVLKPQLVADGLVSVYERLERPLIDVLGRMEMQGITVDCEVLTRLSDNFSQSISELEKNIYKIAGTYFNIGSPKQLADILFNKLGLPAVKKTKTGQLSTSAKILEELANSGNEIAIKIVEWRQLTKLKTTYADTLPNFINKKTRRIHTSYSLASTTTGRLASSDPNLQNIPVRTDEGREIRTAFISAKDNKLISADYSQIELRILAHIADIKQLKQAFADGLDIHRMTASEIFNIPIKDIDPLIRRRAKAINFGIIYGISSFGLASQLGISRTEASDYINTYLQRFSGIKDYMEQTKQICRDKGYVETIFGRRIHYPDINSSNAQHRAFNERAAINAPIQGTAADIIRRAMIYMEKKLVKEKLKAKMLLQVHDELVFESPVNQVEQAICVIKKVMENASFPALSLSVPLQVDICAANNWEQAH